MKQTPIIRQTSLREINPMKKTQTSSDSIPDFTLEDNPDFSNMTEKQYKMHLFKCFLKWWRPTGISLDTATKGRIKESEYGHYLKLLREETTSK